MSDYRPVQADASSLTIHLLDPDAPAATRLLALSDALLQALYPAASNHLESAAALKQDHVIFLGGTVAGEVVACGAAKLIDDGSYAEIKRLFVDEHWRGLRIAERLMAALEHASAGRGVTVFRLETGVSQPAALTLYRRLGYSERPPFGSYWPDPLSVFMEKRLG